jgi:hypothetical protein
MFTLDGGTQLKTLEASGLALQRGPDGSLLARVEGLVIRHARVHTAVGVASVSKITLAGAVVRIAAASSQPSFEVLGLSADEVHLEGVELAPARERSSRLPAAGGWRLEPIAGLQGSLQVSIRDALWVVDAEITLPIADGRLDFDRVVVEHFGPNSAMGIGRNSLYVDAPTRVRTDLFVFTAPAIPGVDYEQRGGFGSRVTDRGSLNLAVFVEALLGAAEDAPVGKPAGRDVQVMLDRTKLSGELRLHDGAMGTDRQHLVLAGQSLGKNRISLSAAVLGHRLVARMPALAASRAVFELFGQTGTTGPVAATIEVHATGLSGTSAAKAAAPGVAVSVHSMTVHDVRLGRTD